MKSKFLIPVYAAVAALILPLASWGQAAPDSGKKASDSSDAAGKYEVFLGLGYTSLNQLPQSRYGLMGYTVSGTRDLGKHFGFTLEGSDLTKPYTSATPTNPGNPSVSMILLGPSVHLPLYERFDLLAHVLLGGAHTGGESATPNVSFAGGFGIGMNYRFANHFSVRAYGDDIFSSFAISGTSVPAATLGLSPHRRGNAHASIGVAYHF